MNELTFVHNNLYGEAMKVAKNFASQSLTRPILNYALHTEEGGLWATDSHRLIYIKDIHGYEDEVLVHAKSGTVAKGGNYPRLDQLISDAEKHTKPAIALNKELIILWMHLFKQMAATMKGVKERFNYVVKISFAEDAVEAEYLSSKIRMKIPCEVIKKPESFETISFSAEYMKQALEAFIALESKTVTISFGGNHRPFILEDEERVKVMILPVRTVE